MASKENVRQSVTSILGVIASVLVILERLLGSDAPLTEIVQKEWPVLVLAVAAGVATIFAARLLTFLLTFLGRKVRPWLRTRKGKLKALKSEIRELRDFETPTGPDAPLQISDYHLRCDELRAKLEKLDIPAPTREQGVIWRSFLTVLYDCAIRRDVEKAKSVLEDLLPEIDVHRDIEAAAKLKALESEIKELHDYNKTELKALGRAEDLEVSHYLQRCDELREDLCKLGIPLPPKMSDNPSLTRWRAFLRKLYGCAIRGDVKAARGLLERLEAADEPAADGATPANPAR